jgi:type IV pilus assembly protein PilW
MKLSSYHRTPANSCGLTLIELLVALAIMSIVLAAVYQVFATTSKNFATQNVAADVQQSVRAALEIITQDIRMAGLDPTSSGNFGIEQASATKLRFTLDTVDPVSGGYNGAVDSVRSERITYEMVGNELRQRLYEGTVDEAEQKMIPNVEHLTFNYFDIDNNALPAPVNADDLEDIRAVEIELTVKEPAGRGKPVSRTLSERIECRNLAFR